MRALNERSLEHNNKVYVYFVDYEKAFDGVNWIEMMDILNYIGVDSEAHNEFIQKAISLRQN